MLLAGDEFCHSQQGNNNAYCQDSPIAWLNWDLSAEQRAHLDFVRTVLQLRKEQPVFRRRYFFQGRSIHGAEIKDLYWMRPDGNEMSDADWSGGHAACLGMGMLGDQISETDERGERIVGDSFLILLNARDEPEFFRIGSRRRNVSWTCVLDTAEPQAGPRIFGHMSHFPLQARSLAVLRPERLSTRSPKAT